MPTYTSDMYVKNRDGDYITPSLISVYLNRASGTRTEVTPTIVTTGHYSYSCDIPEFEYYNRIWYIEWIIDEGTGQIIVKDGRLLTSNLDILDRDGNYVEPSYIAVFLDSPNGQRVEQNPVLIDVGRYSFSYDFPNFSGYDGIYWVEWIVIKDTGKVIIKEPFIISNMLDRWKEEREEREAELVRRRTSDDKVMGILNV